MPVTGTKARVCFGVVKVTGTGDKNWAGIVTGTPEREGVVSQGQAGLKGESGWSQGWDGRRRTEVI